MAKGGPGPIKNVAAQLATQGQRQRNAAYDPVTQALQSGTPAPGLPFDPNDPMSVMPAPVAPKGKVKGIRAAKAVRGRARK